MIGAVVSGLAAFDIIAAATLCRRDEAAGIAVAIPLVLAAGRACRPTRTIVSAYAFG